MPLDEIIRYVSSFLGGGCVAAVGNWVYSNWSARRAREVEVLRDQLRLLYGPLFFFTSQNEQLFKVTGDVERARAKFFEGKNWSSEEEALEELTKRHSATIDLKNAYIERVVKNNEQVMDILEKNWHLADPRDVEVLSRFQVDYTRHLVEIKESRAADVPFPVRMELGDIHFMHPDVIACVRATFDRQRARLTKLTGVRGSTRTRSWPKALRRGMGGTTGC
ncbi:MAG: hypothetical protein ACLQPN_09305 [Bryobacteraceae bacterium]